MVKGGCSQTVKGGCSQTVNGGCSQTVNGGCSLTVKTRGLTEREGESQRMHYVGTRHCMVMLKRQMS